ncbi:lytic murein transglycosylase [Mesorhizobium sp. B2-3-5]|nr:lytic murein transglycosylase [Mesorhizobium sp. B2-3-5]
MVQASLSRAPLCPAGHLPHKGEIGRYCGLRQFSTLQKKSRRPSCQSPHLGGEMSGRTEGGAVERHL